VTRRLTTLLLLLALAAPAGASGAVPKQRASLADIEDEVMCVTCRIPLQLAESPEANRERAFIRSLIRKGETKSEIKSALVAQYGQRVIATPQDSGVDLVAWIVPGLAILVALGALAYAVPRWRGRGGGGEPEPAAAGPTLSPSDERRLDEDLARYGR
jgi:cytochrome c-type biogenesis protein CcmH/NrfF